MKIFFSLIFITLFIDVYAETLYPSNIVKFRALDRVTGRNYTFEAPLNSESIFGELIIIPKLCLKNPPEKTPESATYLIINEIGNPLPIFEGWMFSSSPGLSALEHPVYDVWLLDCLIKD